MREAYVPTEQPQASPSSRFPSPHVHQGGASHPFGASAQGSSEAVGLRPAALKPGTIWAVRGRADFEGLRRSGHRVRRGPLTVKWLPCDPGAPPRVGYAIGRNLGPAVVRNRLRRRLRAVVRGVGGSLPPGAYLIGARPAAVDLSYEELKATVCSALGALDVKSSVAGRLEP
jgi:ribonuclease P protein component